jgi:hypothetical protein
MLAVANCLFPLNVDHQRWVQLGTLIEAQAAIEAHTGGKIFATICPHVPF